jgi:hypothetical protein
MSKNNGSKNSSSETEHHRLCIYISSECFNSEEAKSIAFDIMHRFPQISTEVINLCEPTAVIPDNVFAVPTYVLNGKIISLGNPYREEIMAKIVAMLS